MVGWREGLYVCSDCAGEARVGEASVAEGDAEGARESEEVCRHRGGGFAWGLEARSENAGGVRRGKR